jgi:O-antigen/teichoic acid export membrane protein
VWFVGLLAVGVAFGVVVQATRGLGSIRYFVGLQNVFVPAVRPLLVLLAVGLGSAAWLPAAAWTLPLIPALALAGLALARLLRKAGARADATTPAPLGWRALAREFWSFSVWRGLSSVLEITMLWLDVLLVAALVGVGEAGIYAAASRFATTGTLVLQAMRLAIAPQLSALLATGKTDRAGQVYRTATTWIIAASWPLYLLMAFFSAPVLSIFGSTFSDGATALTILAVAMMFNLATGNVTTVLLMAGRSSWMLFDKSVALVVMVGLDLLLVPAYGVTGAAIGWGASIAVDKGLAVWQVSTKLGLRGGDAGTLLASGASLAWYGGVAAVCTALGLDGWTGLAATLVVAGAGYAPTVWLLRERLHLRPLIDLVIGRSSSTSGGERG